MDAKQIVDGVCAFLDSYKGDPDWRRSLFGPAIRRHAPSWHHFKWRSIEKEINERLAVYGLPPIDEGFRLLFHHQEGQVREDAGGYLRRKWAVAFGVPISEFDRHYYSIAHTRTERNSDAQ